MCCISLADPRGDAHKVVGNSTIFVERSALLHGPFTMASGLADRHRLLIM
jgi:hypothetical protein